MAHWLFLPSDALDDLLILSQLTSDNIVKLRELLDSGEFRLRYKFYVSVAEALDIPDESAAHLSSLINYVQTQRKRMDQPASTIIDELKLYLKRHPKKDLEEYKAIGASLDERRELLSTLFSRLPRQEFSEKRRGLETGPLPHLVSIKTYCDLRPIYDREADEIHDVFPIITLQIVTHSDVSDKAQSILVQLSESDIDDLKKQIERLEKKLTKLKSHPFASSTTNKNGAKS